MIEIAQQCWLMKAAKKYPGICKYIVDACSTAERQKILPESEMEWLEMVPMGNAPDYCKVRLKLEK